MSKKYWQLTFLVIALSLAVMACQPRMKSAKPPSDAPNVPEKLELSPVGLIPVGDAKRVENAKALLLVLSGNQDIEDHVLVRDLITPDEKAARDRLWSEMPQEHKNVVTQLQSQCQVSKKQTRPDLSTLSPTAQFHYGSDLHTEGSGCPAILSRVSEAHGKVITWNKETRNGSYRTASSVKTVSEFLNAEHQKALGMSKGEFTMMYRLDAVRENGEKKKSFLRATGHGYMILTTNNIGRVEIQIAGQELHQNKVKKTVIKLTTTSGGETYVYSLETEGIGLDRKLLKAYVGDQALGQQEIVNLKVENLARKLSLSIN